MMAKFAPIGLRSLGRLYHTLVRSGNTEQKETLKVMLAGVIKGISGRRRGPCLRERSELIRH